MDPWARVFEVAVGTGAAGLASLCPAQGGGAAGGPRIVAVTRGRLIVSRGPASSPVPKVLSLTELAARRAVTTGFVVSAHHAIRRHDPGRSSE
ncbi:MAG: hypothetical protein HY791_15020 [Deltaproteobacteria bacterium]|nr:hypothetical protein [Deltaproteobacteria bacterium]